MTKDGKMTERSVRDEVVIVGDQGQGGILDIEVGRDRSWGKFDVGWNGIVSANSGQLLKHEIPSSSTKN
jgi:hypothetical protein